MNFSKLSTYIQAFKQWIFTKIGAFILFYYPIPAITVLVFSVIIAICGLQVKSNAATPVESFMIDDSPLLEHQNILEESFSIYDPPYISFSFIVDSPIEWPFAFNFVLDVENEISNIDIPSINNCTVKHLIVTNFSLSYVLSITKTRSSAIKFLKGWNLAAFPGLSLLIPKNLKGWSSTYILNNRFEERCLKQIRKKFKQIIIKRQKTVEFPISFLTHNDSVEEFQTASDVDSMFLFSGYSCVFIFLCFSIGSICRILDIKFFVAVFGAMCIALSYAVGIAIPKFLGLRVGPLNHVALMLVAGVGVDDLFVLCAEWDNIKSSSPGISASDLTMRTVKRAGLAISVTTLTDCMGLITGTNAYVFATRSFCLYTVAALISLFIITVVCFTSSLHASMLVSSKLTSTKCQCLSEDCYQDPDDYSLQSLILKRIAYLITQKGIYRWGLIILTTLFFIFGAVGAYKIKADISFDNLLSYLFLSDSYVASFTKIRQKLFERNPALEMYIFHGNLDICEKSNRDLLRNLTHEISEFPQVLSYTVMHWTSYVESSNIIAELRCFFGIDTQLSLKCGRGIALRDTLPAIWSRDASCVTNGRIMLQARDTPDLTTLITLVNDLRNLSQKYSLQIFPCDKLYGFISMVEYTSQLPYQFLKDMIMVALLCFVGLFIFVSKVKSSLLAITSVFMSLIDITSMIHYFGLKLEVATSVIMIISVGFAIDYSTHIVLAYQNVQNCVSKQGRAEIALNEMGMPVLRGGFSTVLPFIPVYFFGKSYVFRTFAKMFVAIVIISLWHSLIFLPTLLANFGDPVEQTIQNPVLHKHIERGKSNANSSLEADV